jgi:hypothetical protein
MTAGGLARSAYAVSMPLGFHIYADLGLLFIRGQGTITQDERVRTMIVWLQDPGYQQCRDAFIDFTATDSTPRVSELRELIAVLRQHKPEGGPSRLAMVVSKPITYGVASVFETLLRLRGFPLEVKVFMDPVRAWGWLRPGEPLFEPR